jgi:DNA-binding LacI/PurR family transcriptional regulator
MAVTRKPRKRGAKTTIFDVAHQAGVAISTVSLALRGDPLVTSRTRAAVLAAAKLLHYQPNVAAQSLARRQTNLIAVCGHFFAETLQFNSYSASQLLMGILARLKGTRYAIYMMNWSTKPGEHLRLLTEISNQRFVCGSIWLTPHLGREDQKLAHHSLPVALAEAVLPDIDSVTVDNVLGGYLGAKHLLRAQRRPRELVLVTGAPTSPEQKERLKGVQKAVSELGHSWSRVRRYRADSYGFLEGERLAAELAPKFSRSKAAISIFCLAGDWCAQGILRGLKKAGIQVPAQVAVLGYDGMLNGNFSNPPLSTIEQPLSELGFAIAGALLERIENPKTPVKQLRLQPKLVLRESA